MNAISDASAPTPKGMYDLIADWLRELEPVLEAYMEHFVAAHPQWEFSIEEPVAYARISTLINVALKPQECRQRNPRLVKLENFRLSEDDFDLLADGLAGIPLLDKQVDFRRKEVSGRTVTFEIRAKSKQSFAIEAAKLRRG